jgi:hypothetical protein
MSPSRGRPTRPAGHRPWEQQPSESDQDYSRFRHYLSLGPQRTLAQASEGAGLYLARLKQLSRQWRWLYRALAWDREQFLRRRREEMEACAQTRERLLKESADWQKLAQLELRSWVSRDAEGHLQLVRELTPSEAIRLWKVGAEALEELLGPAVATAYAQSVPTEPDLFGEPPFMDRLREAVKSAAYHISPSGCEQVRQALWQVVVAWAQYYWKRHPDPDSLDFESSVWPWDLPYAEA